MSIIISDYENKKIRIRSKYTKSYLTVNDYVVKDFSNVGLSNLSKRDDGQKWIVKKKGENWVIASCKDQNFELDYYIGTHGRHGNYGNCTLYKHTEDNLKDANTKFSGSITSCRIKNKNRGEFLHALDSSSDSDVEWKTYEYRDKQL